MVKGVANPMFEMWIRRILSDANGEEVHNMNKKDMGTIGLSVLGLIFALIALKPEDWANNLGSWKTFLLILAIIVFVVILTFYASKKLFNDGYIRTFSSRQDIRLKTILARELGKAKNITAVGIACDELSKQSYNFWKSFLVDRDGVLKMILIDPTGLQVKLREKMVCGKSTGEFADSVKYNIRILYEKINKLKENGRSEGIRANIKTNDFPPVINCIITDECIFLHHYGSTTRGIDMPIYVIRKGRNKINNQAYFFIAQC
jgi:hypothetical protein